MIRLYDVYRDRLLRSNGTNWFSASAHKIYFLDQDYVVNLATHVDESNIPSGTILGTSEFLVPIENTQGYARAGSALLVLGTFSRPCTQLVLVAIGDCLVAHITDEPGLPVQPQAEDLVVEWAASFPGIFRP